MFNFQMGLQKPEIEPKSMDDMRREIEMARRDSSLIGNCLDHARYTGMSGEDTYALLAYRALRMLEEVYRLNLNMINMRPSPIFIPADQVSEVQK